ncbi:hypothetical protein B0H17DRAFT_905135, partial [Mycena rosella]
DYTAYVTPHPHTRFSAESFAAITVAEAHDIVQNNRLPAILPKDSVKKWVFDRAVPTAIPEILVTAGEAIPCVQDILPITQEMDEAFKQGARCIVLELLAGNFVRYHLSKLTLIKNINNQAYPLSVISSLLDHVERYGLLRPHLIDELKGNRFSEPLAGFHVTETALYSLGCLLNERWALEDILNARAELNYFR